MWASAAVCMPRMSGPSTGLEILSRKRSPPAVSARKFWSRSPASGVSEASSPKPSCRISLAAASVKAGGGLVSGSGRSTMAAGYPGRLLAGHRHQQVVQLADEGRRILEQRAEGEHRLGVQHVRPLGQLGVVLVTVEPLDQRVLGVDL